MSKYTTEVRYICEENSGVEESAGYNSTQNVIVSSAPKIFNFYFPIFDEAYRLPLEVKILKHFYTREIGEETVGLWKLRLETRLNEIMPYYNKLYQSELLEFNPLYDADYYRVGDRNGSSAENENVNTNRNGNHSNWNLFSDTPQGGINGIQNAEPSLGSNAYLTNATHNLGETADNSNTGHTDNISTTEDYLEHVYGKFPGKSYSKMLEEFRQTFLNIDMMIISDLEDLFMGLW